MPQDLVLLHGWAVGQKVWQPVIRELGASYRVRVLSLPGYERPDASADRYRSMSAKDILDCWTTECVAGIPSGAIWIGWSLGATVLMNAALHGCSNVAAAVLVSATPKFVRSGTWRAGVEPGLLQGFIEGLRTGSEKIRKRFVLLQAGGSDDPRRLGKTLSGCLSERVDAAVLEAGLRVLEQVDLRAGLRTIRIPVRVIHGSGDRIVPLAAGSYIANQVPQGDLVSLDSGHAPFVAQPGEFSQAVKSWL